MTAAQAEWYAHAVDDRGDRTKRPAAAALMVAALLAACGAEEETPAESVDPPETPAAEEPALPEGVEAPVADEETEPEGSSAAGGARDTGAMTRQRWLASYIPGYITASCRDGFFFRACFDSASESACERDMRAAVRTCAADARVGLGDTVDSQEQSSRITELMGACAGATYERRLEEAGRRIHNTRCDDPSGWGG